MRIAANLSVKDEVELVETTIAHLRAIGIDMIIACDMGSTDGTLDVLERHRSDDDFWIVRLTERTTTEEWSRANLELAKKVDVDWVAFLDADEYLLPATRSLKSCEALIDADVLIIDVFNIPLGPRGPLMPNRLGLSDYGEIALITEPIPQFRSYMQDSPNAPFIRMEWPPKVMARPERIVAVNDGAHSVMSVEGARLRSAKSNDMLIAHLPFSTRPRFARKIDNIRRVFEIHDEYMGRDLGWHWRHWLTLADQGRLDEEFDRNVFDTETISILRAGGVIRSAQEVFQDRMTQLRGRFSDGG
jgi:glycosyltransferase involved in cell wall biosynthesis